jgi:hypothetical protein
LTLDLRILRFPSQDVQVRLLRGQSDGLIQVPERRIEGLLPEVQLAAVLKCLPQLRAQADGLRQQGDGRIRLV